MRAINLAQVTDKTSLKKSWVYAAIKAGDFPAPEKIGRRSVWNEDAIDEWLAKKFAPKRVDAGKGVQE